MITSELQTPAIPSLLDLGVLDESERAAAWRGSANTYFPGIAVRDLGVRPTVGSIAGLRFGPGQLWTIQSPPLLVSYDPAVVSAEKTQLFSVMLQLKGSTFARQGGRAGVLSPGEICVIDGRMPFELSVEAVQSHFIVLQMPRHAVLSRHPDLERRTAESFDPLDSGAVLLRNVLLSVLESAPTMEHDQRTAALAGVIQLLGAPRVSRPANTDSLGWRVRSALAFIDAGLADPELTASRIADAQGVSRRRLDEIMVTATGVSLSSQIWQRRLEQAASDLVDARFASKTVTQIAFAAGFEDVAHFTRAFKRRYRAPPREWRIRHGTATTAPSLPDCISPLSGTRSA